MKNGIVKSVHVASAVIILPITNFCEKIASVLTFSNVY